ncbi:AMP-binding protein [Azorhizophilus paspali]|uniref:AMP-binding protein n=1 Tax=Azorhizophilus paspali TaxID=69963 RepID=UPI0036357FAE
MTIGISKLLDAMTELSSRVTCSNSNCQDFSQIYEDYAKLELEPGSAILFLAGNSLEFIYHWVAIVANQYVPVPASPALKSARIKDLQRSLSLSAVVCSRASASLFEGEQTKTIGSLEFIKFVDAHPAYSAGEVLILTSGTSGLHTACVHKVESLIENARMHNEALGITSSDRQLLLLPMYYSFAMVAQTIGSILSGCHLVIEGPPFTAGRYAKKLNSTQFRCRQSPRRWSAKSSPRGLRLHHCACSA